MDFGLAFVSVALIWIGIGLLLREHHSGAVRDATYDTTTLVRAFEESISRTISIVDRTLLAAREAYRQDPAHFDIGIWAERAQATDDLTIRVSILDRDGYLMMSSQKPTPRLFLGERAYFRTHHDNAADTLSISKPTVTRFDGRMVIQFSRRLTDRDGSFAGVIVAALDPDALSHLYSSLATGGDAVMLVGLDGIVRAHAPESPPMIGRDVSASRFLSQAATADHGTFWSLGRYEGVPRLYSFRKLKCAPLIAAVGFETRAIFAEYHRMLRCYLVGGGILTGLILLATSWLVWRRWQAQSKIIHLARHDALTGLPNRLWFGECLLQAAQSAACSGQGFAVLCLDLDHFKLVNDLRGHDAGDRLLKQVAARLRGAVHHGDMIARLGGDEFAIMHALSGGAEAVAALAKRLVERLTEPYEVDGQQVAIGTSIGIARYPADGVEAEELLKKADAALYSAKGAGRNTFHLFEAAMQVRLSERRDLEQDLRDALMHRQLQLHYQPVWDVERRTIIGFEALLRWIHPTRGTVSPADFIPVAEQSGLIVPLGRWVLETACAEAANWPRSVRVAINLSPVQFLEAGLAEQIVAILRRTGLKPARLLLEVTEGVLIANGHRAKSVMATLREAEIMLALDDFGTGHASLSYLKQFPFDTVKIDKSYVQGAAEDLQSRAVLQGMMMVAQNLGLDVVAEGVETEAQLAVLRQLGCQRVQGFLLGRPVPPEHVEDLLAEAIHAYRGHSVGCQIGNAKLELSENTWVTWVV